MPRTILEEARLHPAIRERVATLQRRHRPQRAGGRRLEPGAGGRHGAATRIVRRARKALEAAGIAHHYLEYGSYFSEWRRRNALKMWTGWPTFPMVFVKRQAGRRRREIEALIDERRAEATARPMSPRGLRSLAAVAAAAACLAVAPRPPLPPTRRRARCASAASPAFATACCAAASGGRSIPGRPQRGTIDIHYVVVPALARNKLPDPVFFLAGGPGQSAIALAPQVMAAVRAAEQPARHRASSTSAAPAARRRWPARTREDEPLAEQAEPERQQRADRAMQGRAACKQPWLKADGDLRFFTTTIAMQDLDAVRRQLGAERINLVGGSYGTRAALEFLRQFPRPCGAP